MAHPDQRGTDPAIGAILEGGPTDLPEVLRQHRDPGPGGKIKVPHRGGYEHFERTPDDHGDDQRSTVYRWTMRTRVAE